MRKHQEFRRRLEELEARVNFTMQIQRVTIGVGSPLEVNRQMVTCSLADLYRQVRQEGGKIVEAQEVTEVTKGDTPETEVTVSEAVVEG